MKLNKIKKKFLENRGSLTAVTALVVIAVVAGFVAGYCIPDSASMLQKEKTVYANDSIVVETVDKSATADTLENIKTYLDSVEKSIDNNLELIQEVKENTSTTENNTQNSLLIKQVDNVNTEMTTINKSITDTKDIIKALQDELQKDGTNNTQTVTDKITEVTNNLQTIKESYTTSQESIKSLIKEIEKSRTSDSKELLKYLKTMQNNMDDSDVKRFDDMNKQLASTEKNISNQLSTMDKGIIDQLNNGNINLVNQLGILEQNISSQYSNGNADITNQLDQINQNIQNSFTSVNNGKKLLASTLFTVHGISINEDATFAQISEAIKSIEREYYLGVQEIPGEISYDYHHHVDGEGNYCTEERVAAEHQGGCFTIPHYHVHQGNNLEKGGCYTVPVYHKHGSGCYREGTSFNMQNMGSAGWSDGGCEASYWKCRDCGYTFQGTTRYEPACHHNCPKHRTLICKKSGSHIDRYALGCGKTKGTLEGYDAACGFVENQIVAAHIVYNQNAVKDGVTTRILESSLMVESLNPIPMQDLLEDIITDNPPEADTLPMPAEPEKTGDEEIQNNDDNKKTDNRKENSSSNSSSVAAEASVENSEEESSESEAQTSDSEQDYLAKELRETEIETGAGEDQVDTELSSDSEEN